MVIERKPSASTGTSPSRLPETLPELEVSSDTPGSLLLKDYKEKLDVWWRETRAAIERKFEELES